MMPGEKTRLKPLTGKIIANNGENSEGQVTYKVSFVVSGAIVVVDNMPEAILTQG